MVGSLNTMATISNRLGKIISGIKHRLQNPNNLSKIQHLLQHHQPSKFQTHYYPIGRKNRTFFRSRNGEVTEHIGRRGIRTGNFVRKKWRNGSVKFGALTHFGSIGGRGFLGSKEDQLARILHTRVAHSRQNSKLKELKKKKEKKRCRFESDAVRCKNDVVLEAHVLDLEGAGRTNPNNLAVEFALAISSEHC